MSSNYRVCVIRKFGVNLIRIITGFNLTFGSVGTSWPVLVTALLHSIIVSVAWRHTQPARNIETGFKAA